MLLLGLFLSFSSSVVLASPKSSFECGGCMVLVNSIEESIKKVDPAKMIEVGSFRVGPKGEQKGIKTISFARSESHISEILEHGCDKSKEYKLVVNKSTGKAVFAHSDNTGLKGDESSQMRSKLHGAESVFVFYSIELFMCNDIMDSHEDDLVKFLQQDHADPVKEFCQLELGVRSSVDVTPLPEWGPEDAEADAPSKVEDEL